LYVNKDKAIPLQLRRIMNIKWTDMITNEELLRITHQKSIEKTTLDWNPQGYRRRGRPKRTW